MNSAELEQSVKKGKFPLVCCLHGEEDFLVERMARQIVASAVDPAMKDFNINVYYGNESKGVDILDTAQTLPMFSERRLVMVKRVESLKADVLELLLPYLLNPCPSTCLVFIGAKIDQRKKFFQELKKQGGLVEYKRLYDNKIPDFIKAEVSRHHKNIEQAATTLLFQLVGNNLSELSSQIEKITVYCGSRQLITVDDVQAIASSSKAYTIFELTRFLAVRDLRSTLACIETLSRSNSLELPPLLGALSRHFRQMWRIRELLEKNTPADTISRELAIPSFFMGDLVRQARGFNRKELADIFNRLYRSDLALKSGSNPHSLLFQLAYDICGVS